MTISPLFAALLGGWEMLLILSVLLVMAVGFALVIGVIFHLIRRDRRRQSVEIPPRI